MLKTPSLTRLKYSINVLNGINSANKFIYVDRGKGDIGLLYKVSANKNIIYAVKINFAKK